MAVELVAVVERVFKAFVFVPCMALIAWWVISAWLDRLLTVTEAVVALLLLLGAFLLGVASIIAGGWGFLGVLGLIYVVLLAVAAWEYLYWKRKEREHWREMVARYQEAIARDPNNVAAYSFLGRTHLKLGRLEEAVEAFERAVRLAPGSLSERGWLREARNRLEREGLRRRRQRS